MNSKPFLGFGLGLRPDHYTDILAQSPPVDWFEIITENYFSQGGKPLYYLDQIRERYPIVMHGVSLSIGSQDPIDWDYLKSVKKLIQHVSPHWLSDHLCWTGAHGKNLHDLLPLPYTEETIQHVANRIREVQDFLERKILIENVSSYLTYQESKMTEWDFLKEIAERADCFILLDVNNIYVSSVNHEFDAMDYIKAMPKERIYQIHLAGHSHEGDYIIDTHDHPIVDPVWDLFQKTWEFLGPVSTMIERDDHIPPLKTLLKELEKARSLVTECVT